MGRKRFAVLATVALLAMEASAPLLAQEQAGQALHACQPPAWAPPPPEPASNPSSEAKVELGRRLFYDGRLAADGMRACATCHQQARSFSEPLQYSWGVTGEQTTRNAPMLANVAYARMLTWVNPTVSALEEQALGPMLGQNPVEMGMAGQEEEILVRLSEVPVYRDLFARAFPETGGAITLKAVVQSIAAFERTLVSLNAPWDRAHRGGEPSAMSDAARRGEALFMSDRLKCGSCHGGLHLSDAYGEGAADPLASYHNVGLYDLDGKGAYPARNPGLSGFTGNPADAGRVRTPSLRNVAVTGPYMHDGSIATLEAVIDHYAAGGGTARAAGPAGSVGRDSPLKDPRLTGFALSDGEKADLLAFLASLTDESFLTSPYLSNPWK